MIDFIIIGGQKCGSTYLQNIISDHPAVNMIPGETPYFENPDYDQYGKDALDILPKKISMLTGCKRPTYLSKAEVPSRIHSYNSEAKIIVILRNRIDRFKSAYFHYMNQGFIPIKPINKGIINLLDGSWKDKYPRSSEILEFGLYYEGLKRYRTGSI